MRMPRYFLFIFFAFTGSRVFSQKIQVDQGFGLSASTANLQGSARLVTATSIMNIDYTVTQKQFGIVYYPRVDMLSRKSGSISIGAPIMIGLGFSNKYHSVDFDGTTSTVTEGIKGSHIAFNVPLVADLNIGLHSAKEESRKKNFGIYVGGGYGYHYTKIKTSVGKVLYDGFDPVLRAGIRMGSAWENRVAIGFTMSGSVSDKRNRTYELHFLKDL